MLGAYHGDGKPVSSGALAAKSYAVEGVGKDSVPGCMNFAIVDAMLSVTDK
jgi:cysteine synthase